MQLSKDREIKFLTGDNVDAKVKVVEEKLLGKVTVALNTLNSAICRSAITWVQYSN